MDRADLSMLARADSLHHNLAAPFRNAIDNEPWLSMLAWADSLEEEGSSYSHRFAKVLRWMVERRNVKYFFLE